LDLRSAQASNDFFREDISEYVAQLQLHMTLQARNLVPNLIKAADSREQLLQQTQATIEKLVSRQAI
jgi:acetyl-CoA carboxylase carboxyltransferase component